MPGVRAAKAPAPSKAGAYDQAAANRGLAKGASGDLDSASNSVSRADEKSQLMDDRGYALNGSLQARKAAAADNSSEGQIQSNRFAGQKAPIATFVRLESRRWP